MSRWNAPVYNWFDKLAVIAIVCVLILGYEVSVGAPITPVVIGVAVVSAAVALAIALGLAAATPEADA